MLYPPQPSSPMVERWWERHRHPGSLALHVLGIPLTIGGVLLIPVWLFGLSVPVFLFALTLFVVGYALQFLGHAWDRTMPGELEGLRLWYLRRLAAKEPRAEQVAVPVAVAAGLEDDLHTSEFHDDEPAPEPPPVLAGAPERPDPEPVG